MFERFSDRARRVVVLAQEAARDLGHSHIGTEHILLGLVAEKDGVGAQALALNGINIETAREAVVARTSAPSGAVGGTHIPFTPRSKKVLELALREALQLGHNYIGTEHILLGLVKEGEGIGAQVLTQLGVDSRALRGQVVTLISGGGSDVATEASGGIPAGTPAGSTVLDQFGVNLTQAARDGKLDPVIGRAKELERVMQVLCRRTKNNPCLIGEPGVGKTAVVEGLAQKIASGDVPAILEDKQVYSLDLSSMVAGARYRGEFEERMKKVLKEIQQRGDVLVFIDEIHTLVGAGAAEGAIDAANMLKPMLARGELQTIGATTLDEYRKHIEKDPALERRFQPVKVDEPNVADTILILKGLRPRYEGHHKVQITDEAIKAAATLADRYINDRFMPDKAIDLLDEAGAMLRIRRMGIIGESELSRVQREKQEKIEAQDYEAAGSLRLQEEKLQTLEDEKQDTVLDEHAIMEVLATSTGIPVMALTQDESKRLLGAEDELRGRVIGQDHALEVVGKAIRRMRAGLKDPKRPGGSFIFAGPTGVGKTELTKTLAQYMFGDEKALLRLDMSEYAEKHTVSRLVGSPPGYVGHEEGGQLTEMVRRRPYSVVLFDEVEKAHPDVFNTLLQVLEDGRLTDSQGKVVDFKNTILVFTSNLGTGDLAKSSVGFTTGNAEDAFERMSKRVNQEIKSHFRPEFLNRIDEVVVFRQLDLDNIKEITDLLVNRLAEQLQEQDMEILLTDNARLVIAEVGYDPVMGARPLRRAVQRLIEDELSEKILMGQVKPGQIIVVDALDGKLTFTGTDKPETPDMLKEEVSV